MIRTVKAKVLDKTHLELSRPIPLKRGMDIQVLISDENEDRLWKTASKKSLLKAYGKSHAVYDKL